MFHPMKPETAARRRIERAQEMRARLMDVQRRFILLAENESDPDGLWAECLADHILRHGRLI